MFIEEKLIFFIKEYQILIIIVVCTEHSISYIVGI